MKWALIPGGALLLSGLLIGAAPGSRARQPVFDAGGDELDLVPDLSAGPTPETLPPDVPPAAPPPKPKKPRLSPSHPRFPGPGGAAATNRCELCHSVEGWTVNVRFNHDKTGFVLKGAHASAECVECHAEHYAGTPTTCASCHQDAHRGQLGQRCQECHQEERGWSSPTFDADAHRNTNFPLIGRHAMIPCEECHLDRRDRTFGRATVDCNACHAADFARAGALGVNHLAAGFSTNCRECHSFWQWVPAQFPQHDACFQLSGGPHRGLTCESCHSPVPNPPVMSQCLSPTTVCTSCHDHTCSRSNAQHPNVPGYQCQDQKCYGCHRFAIGGG